MPEVRWQPNIRQLAIQQAECAVGEADWQGAVGLSDDRIDRVGEPPSRAATTFPQRQDAWRALVVGSHHLTVRLVGDNPEHPPEPRDVQRPRWPGVA